MKEDNYKAYIFQNEYGEYLIAKSNTQFYKRYPFDSNIHFAEITIDVRRVDEVKEKYPKIKVIECELKIKQ